ncbi:sulfate/molybdate ABC transporter ATP-binding protein [Sphingomonas solaris]|uniref:Sulfate/molybdate ABC transporter ATP-binding protein n=1 Tax=Alterirhizorhabdus solaris TaxID=2529389 RepID=A0A558QXJ0_9SPHN|nr:sulfate/molybdate ABC transporter ATP-binding protein [Sphingomonas solaris]TVV71871.1 sulfate/molybdate ABC transporter ATP-binding protein [Sphingomonas solaris]
MGITVSGISKRFGAFTALGDIDLEARPGEFLALLGPSGSGKTTLLRIIAGLEFPDTGTVAFDGVDVTNQPITDRGVGFVFQQYALFRHMTVADNVAFGLTVRKRSTRPAKAEIARRVEELLDLVQLKDLGKRYPAQLSGGQRQRVALARALAVEPRILLLDEPFGALDAKVRKDLRRWLRELHDRMGLTSIFVTHDQEEALELADRVVVMDHGVIEQVSAPEAIYNDPASAFVFDFVGESNRLPVSVRGGRAHFGGHAFDVATDGTRDGDATLFFRPHDVEIVGAGAAALPAVVSLARPRGGGTRIEARIEGREAPLELDYTGDAPPRPGDRIGVRPLRARLFPAG